MARELTIMNGVNTAVIKEGYFGINKNKIKKIAGWQKQASRYVPFKTQFFKIFKEQNQQVKLMVLGREASALSWWGS